MTLEFIAVVTIMVTIIGAAVALATVIVPGQRAIRQEMGEMRRDIGDLRERMARIEGLFEGFTRSPATPAAPSPRPQQ